MMAWIGEDTAAAITSAVHSDDLPRERAAWLAALEGAPYEIEHRLVADGEVRWVYVRATTDFEEGRSTRGRRR